MSSFIQKILDRIDQPKLLDQLSKLSGSELNSLLLEVMRTQTLNCPPSQLLKRYQLNRFVKPADLPVVELRQAELDLLKIFQACSFEPLELSPVSILGACSVVALADQKKILSALRGTEVLADATNALALHISDLKKTKAWIPTNPNEKLRFATIQRHVRTQAISAKGFTPHFKIGCLVTSGIDTGNFAFESEALTEHLKVMKEIFLSYYCVDHLSFRLLCRNGYPDSFRLAEKIKEHALQSFPDIVINIVKEPEKDNGYYKGVQYKVDINVNNRTFEIADGGFVDWTQQLLQNKKERFLITGFGFEFMHRIVNGSV